MARCIAVGWTLPTRPSRESGDVEYVCRFDPSGRVRREGSFIYQARLLSGNVGPENHRKTHWENGDLLGFI